MKYVICVMFLVLFANCGGPNEIPNIAQTCPVIPVCPSFPKMLECNPTLDYVFDGDYNGSFMDGTTTLWRVEGRIIKNPGTTPRLFLQLFKGTASSVGTRLYDSELGREAR